MDLNIIEWFRKHETLDLSETLSTITICLHGLTKMLIISCRSQEKNAGVNNKLHDIKFLSNKLLSVNFSPQEFSELKDAIYRYMDEYGVSNLPDLRIGGWTIQNGLISYPQDYNSSMKQSTANYLCTGPLFRQSQSKIGFGKIGREGLRLLPPDVL